MDALGSGGGFLWNWRFSMRPRGSRRPSKSSDSADGTGNGSGRGSSSFEFPLKPAATAASLAVAGDTIAQVRDKLRAARSGDDDSTSSNCQKDIVAVILENHDWLRSLRMASYGFLLYGPGSYAWYQFLDRSLPQPTLMNFSLKVILNQIVLGPCVIAVVFAWNNLWQKKLSELPEKYRKDALPTLLYGFRFWIPVSILNFGVIPLQARVAFMSTCAIFWNFYLSSTMSK